MSERDEQFMRLALELARRGRGAVEPNPMVGAVLVRQSAAGPVELARGWHRLFGGPHAEAECLAAAVAAGADPRGATMYVTLEPCFAFPGKKTPPCCDALVAAGVGRVVVAMADPDPHVAGRGIDALRRAGLTVDVGICESLARSLLAGYVKLRTAGRPWVICKWAQTADGFLSLPAGAGLRWISNEQSRAMVHEVRSWCDGVCVGAGTVLADDPLLTNRSGAGKQPGRLVLDTHLRTPPTSQLARTARQSPVIVATAERTLAAGGPAGAAADELRRLGVEILPVPSGPGGLNLEAVLDELGRWQWTYLLVEGGAKVLESFLSRGLADEVLVFIGPRRVAGQIVASEQAAGPSALPRFDIAEALLRWPMDLQEERSLETDTFRRYLVRR